MRAVLIIFFGLIVVFAAHSLTSGFGGGPTASTANDPDDQTGCSASKRSVSAQLKSPGSASWVSCRVTTAAGVQTVMLAVDSQNASGALVRTEWMTKVRDNNVESVAQIR